MPRLRSLGHRRAVLALSRPPNTGDKLRSGARAHPVSSRGHSAAPPSAAPPAARGRVPPKASSASSPCSTAPCPFAHLSRFHLPQAHYFVVCSGLHLVPNLAVIRRGALLLFCLHLWPPALRQARDAPASASATGPRLSPPAVRACR